MPALPLVLFGSFVLLVVLMNLRLRRQGYRMLQRPRSGSVSHSFDEWNSIKIKGGSRVGGWNASYPLVTLTLDHTWAHLSGFVPVWVQRSEVTAVRRVRSLIGSGIMFDTADGDLAGVIFWTRDPSRVLHAFEQYGWPITSS